MNSENNPEVTQNKNRYIRFQYKPEKETKEEQPKSDNNNDAELASQLKSYEVALGHRNAIVKDLQNDRVKQVTINRTLQKQVKELQDSLMKSPRRKGPTKASLTSTYIGMNDEETSIFYHVFSGVFRAPRRALCIVANRITLFTWWVGMWANEGLSILRIENKWLELQKSKDLLEQEKTSLEEHLNYMQKLIDEKASALERERELNKNLLDRIQKIGIVTGSWGSSKDVNQRLGMLFESMYTLSDSMDHMRKKIEKNASSMEVVYERVIKMLENQTRLESHEKALEEMLKYMAMYCARTKQDEIKRTEVQHRCFRCSNYLLNNGDNDNMDDIKPHNISQDTN